MPPPFSPGMSGMMGPPFIWQAPSTEPKHLLEVRAGDWVMIDLSYRRTSTTPVVMATSGGFLAHVLYSPNESDTPVSVEGRAQPFMRGGTNTKRRPVYRIDPGWTWQAPWDGQISVVASGNSDPETCAVDIICRLGQQPEELGFRQDAVGFDDVGMAMAMVGFAPPSPPRRMYAPPVIGSPLLVPSTYVDLKGSSSEIYFSSGVVGLQVTDDLGGTTFPVMVKAFGNTFNLTLASGVLEPLAMLAVGGGASDSKNSLWIPGRDLSRATVWSRLGC